MGAGRSIDLSADVGEATDAVGISVERDLLEVVSSVHVACGGHAGDDDSMRATVQAATDGGVAVGAHPSYPDREGFGRRLLSISMSDLEASLREQIAALVDVCGSESTSVRSVKAHGALYGEVAKGGPPLAALLAAMAAHCGRDTPLVLPARSVAVGQCRAEGIAVQEEGFCDRAYAPDGTLVDRSVAGAVLRDPDQAAEQAVRLTQGGTIDTLCVHGDSPSALAMARAVRRALEAAGLRIGSALTL
jgi:UPF0271 protein